MFHRVGSIIAFARTVNMHAAQPSAHACLVAHPNFLPQLWPLPSSLPRARSSALYALHARACRITRAFRHLSSPSRYAPALMLHLDAALPRMFRLPPALYRAACRCCRTGSYVNRDHLPPGRTATRRAVPSSACRLRYSTWTTDPYARAATDCICNLQLPRRQHNACHKPAAVI